ncbi:putative panusin-like 4 [Homarus americanus]|uniref:Putative panusin-like 4 n=1 Tax=Homarus americanus TaxID=6706 RepID=A0A8J5NEP9_HOMAM|nr:putative panusin-like 4 [Homarus americanus]
MNTKSIVFLLVLVIVAITVVNVLYERLCTVYQSYMNTKYRVPVFMNTFARNSNKEISKCGLFFPSPIFFHDKSEISGLTTSPQQWPDLTDATMTYKKTPSTVFGDHRRNFCFHMRFENLLSL